LLKSWSADLFRRFVGIFSPIWVAWVAIAAHAMAMEVPAKASVTPNFMAL
jgi:hypothetical protein